MFAAMIGGWELVLILAILAGIPLAVAIFAFWIWMMVHAIQNRGLNEGERVAWVLVTLLLHFLGALLYFFFGRSKARQPPIPAT